MLIYFEELKKFQNLFPVLKSADSPFEKSLTVVKQIINNVQF